MNVISQEQNSLTGIVSAPPFLSFYDLPQVIQEMPVASEYEQWRSWRYQNISMEFQEATWAFAAKSWEMKRPWWLGMR